MNANKAIAILDDMKVKIPVPKRATLQNDRNEALDIAIEALKHQWIPCSERPPKVRERVLACKKDGSMLVMRCIDEGHLTWFYSGVIAWMPCPEPYREESNERTE